MHDNSARAIIAYMPVALQRYALTMNKCLDTNEKNARQSKKIIER